MTCEELWDENQRARDRLEQPSRCPAGLGLIRISCTSGLSVCVCVCVRQRESVFTCTSREAQWAGADAPSSHSNSLSKSASIFASSPLLFICTQSATSVQNSHLDWTPFLCYYYCSFLQHRPHKHFTFCKNAAAWVCGSFLSEVPLVIWSWILKVFIYCSCKLRCPIYFALGI